MNKNLGPKIIELRSKGHTYNKICQLLGCSKSVVSYHLGTGQKTKNVNRGKKRRTNPLFRKIEHFALKMKRSKLKISKNSIKTVLQRKREAYMRNKFKYQTPTFSIQDLIKKIGNNPKCYLTGRPIDLSKGRSYHLDHIIPRSKGGSNNLDNANICCKEANQSKTDMTVTEFIALCKEVLEHHGYIITKERLQESNL